MTTIPLRRFGGKKLSTTPVFQGDFQRIEGPAVAKEVSHGAEQVIVGWRHKIRAICGIMDEEIQFQKHMLSIDQGCWITTSRESGIDAIIQSFTVECCCVHCTISNKLKLIIYPQEIPPDPHNDLVW